MDIPRLFCRPQRGGVGAAGPLGELPQHNVELGLKALEGRREERRLGCWSVVGTRQGLCPGAQPCCGSPMDSWAQEPWKE